MTRTMKVMTMLQMQRNPSTSCSNLETKRDDCFPYSDCDWPMLLDWILCLQTSTQAAWTCSVGSSFLQVARRQIQTLFHKSVHLNSSYRMEAKRSNCWRRVLQSPNITMENRVLGTSKQHVCSLRVLYDYAKKIQAGILMKRAILWSPCWNMWLMMNWTKLACWWDLILPIVKSIDLRAISGNFPLDVFELGSSSLVTIHVLCFNIKTLFLTCHDLCAWSALRRTFTWSSIMRSGGKDQI